MKDVQSWRSPTKFDEPIIFMARSGNNVIPPLWAKTYPMEEEKSENDQAAAKYI
jgi:hypothetical protein